MIVSLVLHYVGAHYFRKARARVHGYTSAVKRMRRGPGLSYASAYERANLKVQWCTKRKKYFRFALVVPTRTVQQPRDSPSKVCSIRESALQTFLRPPSFTLSLALSLLPFPVLASFYHAHEPSSR